jgi:hypothetical protein
MKTMSSVFTRRDRCHLIGRRAGRLNMWEAGHAWLHLAEKIERVMGSPEPGRLPKFNDLLIAVRVATVLGKLRCRRELAVSKASRKKCNQTIS